MCLALGTIWATVRCFREVKCTVFHGEDKDRKGGNAGGSPGAQASPTNIPQTQIQQKQSCKAADTGSEF